jgi:hypothetical protein
MALLTTTKVNSKRTKLAITTKLKLHALLHVSGKAKSQLRHSTASTQRLLPLAQLTNVNGKQLPTSVTTKQPLHHYQPAQHLKEPRSMTALPIDASNKELLAHQSQPLSQLSIAQSSLQLPHVRLISVIGNQLLKRQPKQIFSQVK